MVFCILQLFAFCCCGLVLFVVVGELRFASGFWVLVGVLLIGWFGVVVFVIFLCLNSLSGYYSCLGLVVLCACFGLGCGFGVCIWLCF